jgi:penicillin V acylase-like amidase (Ntn superfamily)
VRAFIIFMIGLVCASACHACTTFCFEADGTRVFGKNYDWNVDDGLVVVNKRGVSKVAFTEENPARWTSRFGSVTFNQYGREFPSGGINEKGLVVELMWLDETAYPSSDGRAVLPTLQWIQYQLDNAATIDDVIKSDATVRISPAGSAKIHFLVADARGGVATIEYIEGKLVTHRGEDLPYPVLTNDTYEGSRAYARTARVAQTESTSSLDRFARAARGLSAAGDAVARAFALLHDVAQGDYTQWSIVYDIGDKRAYFRTRVQPSVRFIDVDALDLSCRTPVRVVDVNAALAGDVSANLVEYSVEANRQLVGAAFAETEFLRATPAQFVEALARYPELTSCAP